METVSASVGKGGVNRAQDVLTIQKLLNQYIGPFNPMSILKVDGHIGPRTIKSIENFQRTRLKMARPDGRVDPNGRTILALRNKRSASAPNPISSQPKVTYSSKLSAAKHIVSKYAISVIKIALREAGMSHGVITSTIRTPAEQARIMYREAKKNYKSQLDLYGSTGDEVLKVFKANTQKPETEVVNMMTAKIEEFLQKGRRTSKHVVATAYYNSMNIIDIGVYSTRIASGASFNLMNLTQAFRKLKTDGYIVKFIDETYKSNNCWHIEVKPNLKPLPAN